MEFTLELGDQTVPLAAATVTREALLAHKDLKFTILCTMAKPRLPSPEEAHSAGLDRAALARPAKCAVTSLTPAR